MGEGSSGVAAHGRVTVEAEWHRLDTVAVVRPIHFEVVEPVNETQLRFYDTADRPRREILLRQHDRVLRQLRTHGVRVVEIPAVAGLPLQFNVRDAGAVIGSTLYLGRMTRAVRGAEPSIVAERLAVSTCPVWAGHWEGGDVLVVPGQVFVGLGERTDPDGLAALRALLEPRWRVSAIRLADQVLHLDVAMLLIGQGTGLVHRPSILGDLPEALRDVDWVEVTEEECAEQGVNVLSLDSRTVMLDERHERIRQILTRRGFHCVPLELQELGKVGGSIRCMTLPLARSDRLRVFASTSGD